MTMAHDPDTARLSIRDRIGIDVGRRLPVEAAVEWAADNGVRYVPRQP
jgi:hypothetical protein